MGVVRGEELGYQFHPATWGKGLATEAVSAFVEKLAQHPELIDIGGLVAWIADDNQGSMRVAEKVGFVKREEKIVEDDRYTDDQESVELSHEELEELRKSVEAMNLPVRTDIPPRRPRKMIKLVIFELDGKKIATLRK